jgi:hypothetical protein
MIPVTTQQNRGTVRHGDFYPSCMAVQHWTTLCIITKKVLLTGQKPAHAPPLSMHGCWKNDGPLKYLHGVQTNEKSKEQGQVCMQDVERSKKIVLQ